MNRLTYYIGDVHGRRDLLDAVLGWAEADAAARGGTPVFSFVGDLIDRGPESRQVVETVRQILEKYPGSNLHLGNHDEWFLEAIDTDGEFQDFGSWFLQGGRETIESYDPAGKLNPDVFDHIRETYPLHVRMLRDAARYSFSGPFMVAHAGYDPRYPLEDQNPQAFNWIRDGFLEFVEPAMRPVIHGHTIVGRRPVVTENRISIDTGAVHYGLLTCFAVDHANRSYQFVQANDHESVESVEPLIVNRGHPSVLDRFSELFELYAEREPHP